MSLLARHLGQTSRSRGDGGASLLPLLAAHFIILALVESAGGVVRLEAEVRDRGILVGVHQMPSTSHSVLYNLTDGTPLRSSVSISVTVRRCTYANGTRISNSTLLSATPETNSTAPAGNASAAAAGPVCFPAVGVFIRLIFVSLSSSFNETVARSNLLADYGLLEMCASYAMNQSLLSTAPLACQEYLPRLALSTNVSGTLQRTEASGTATFSLVSSVCSAASGPSLVVPVFVRSIEGVDPTAIALPFNGVSLFSIRSSLTYVVHAQEGVCSGSYSTRGPLSNATTTSASGTRLSTVFGYLGHALSKIYVQAYDSCGGVISGSAQIVAYPFTLASMTSDGTSAGGTSAVGTSAGSVSTVALSALVHSQGVSGSLRVLLNNSVGIFDNLFPTTNISRLTGTAILAVLLRMHPVTHALLGTTLTGADLRFLTNDHDSDEDDENATLAAQTALVDDAELVALAQALSTVTTKTLPNAYNFSGENFSSWCGSMEVAVSIIPSPIVEVVPVSVAFRLEGDSSVASLSTGTGFRLVIEVSHAILVAIPTCQEFLQSLDLASSRSLDQAPRGFIFSINSGYLNCTPMIAVEKNAVSGGNFSQWSTNETQSAELFKVTPSYVIQIQFLPNALYFCEDDEVITVSLPPSMFSVPVAENTSLSFVVAGIGKSAAEVAADILMLLALPGTPLRVGTLSAIIVASSGCYSDVTGPLPLAIHPLHFSISAASETAGYLVAAVVSNFVIFFTATIIHAVVDAVNGYQEGSFPHYGLIVAYTLFPGACIGGFKAVSMNIPTITFYVTMLITAIYGIFLPVASVLVAALVSTRWVPLRDEQKEGSQRKAPLQSVPTPSSLTYSATYMSLVRSRFLRVMCEPSGFYYCSSKDHDRFRAAYDFYRGGCMTVGVIEMVYPLLIACCYMAPCPKSVIGVLVVICLHVLFTFALHPRLSIGGNMLSLVADLLCVVGVTLVLKEQEQNARIVFLVVQLVAGIVNVSDLALRVVYYVTVERHLAPPTPPQAEDGKLPSSVDVIDVSELGSAVVAPLASDREVLVSSPALPLGESAATASLPAASATASFVAAGRLVSDASFRSSLNNINDSPESFVFGEAEGESSRSPAHDGTHHVIAAAPSTVGFDVQVELPKRKPLTVVVNDDACDDAMAQRSMEEEVDMSMCIHKHTALTRRESSRSPSNPQTNVPGREMPQLAPHLVTTDGRHFARSDADSVVTRVYVTPKGVCESREWRPGSYEYNRKVAVAHDQEAADHLTLLEIAKRFEGRYKDDSASRRLHWLAKEDESEAQEEQALLLKLFNLGQHVVDRSKPGRRVTFAERRQAFLQSQHQAEDHSSTVPAAPDATAVISPTSDAAPAGRVARRVWSPSISAYEYEML